MAPDELEKELAAGTEAVRAKVESDLRRHFLLDRICEAEDLRVGEQELLGALEQLARESGRSTGDLIEHFQEDPSRLAELRAELRHGKAREAIRRAAVLVEEAPPAAAK
jgi:FKBP-type peptidyl-prolyl cis-trans isomerase (trigger factor)